MDVMDRVFVAAGQLNEIRDHSLGSSLNDLCIVSTGVYLVHIYT